MNVDTQDRGGSASGFVFGLLTGTVVGAGLAMWLAPRLTSELRARATDSARIVGERASERYQQVSARVRDTVEAVTTKSRAVRDDVAGAVARGAHEVERVAKSVQTDA